MKAFARFIVGVKKETKKIRWISKEEMIKYSIATLVVVFVFGIFFSVLDFALTGIKMVVR